MSVYGPGSSQQQALGNAFGEVSPLSALLDEDYYLIKIFPHLIDDGLQECRRVCRKWKNICDKLPVHLGRIDVMELRGAAALFPNAVSLRSCTETKQAAALCTTLLAAFSHLRHLTMSYARDRIELLRIVDPLPEDRQIYPRSLQNLVSLAVSGMPTQWSLCFHAFLRGLTNLTSLKLQSFRPEDAPSIPFRELHLLRELHVGLQFLINRDGNYLFPSLPKLTSLSVEVESNPLRQGGIRVLEKMLPYSATVENLEITSSFTVFGAFSAHISDWSLLPFFEKLTSLSLVYDPIHEGGFLETLRQMTQLTCLHLQCGSCDQTVVLNVIYSLTKLESLTFNAPGRLYSRPERMLFSHLTGLTYLETNTKLRKIAWLPNCSGLVNLKLHRPSIVLHGLANSPFSLWRLEHLSLFSVKGSDLPPKSLALLAKLKSLDLDMADNEINENFFYALAHLPELTSLKFLTLNSGQFPLHLRFHFNILSSLRELSLSFEESEYDAQKMNPCNYLCEGAFPFLRTLDLQHTKLSNEDEAELWRRYPQLRNIWFSGRYRKRQQSSQKLVALL